MKIKMNDLQVTFNKLYNLLSTEKKVYYTRFGDGEFNFMADKGQCINHTESPELKKELIESFIIDDPKYIRGVMIKEPIFNGHQLKVRQNSEDELMAINFIESILDGKDEVVFDSHVLLTYLAMSKQSVMIDFLDRFIRPKKKIFIGSVDKDKIEKMVGKIDYYIEVPIYNAYYSMDEWWPKVLNHIDDVELVLPTAGPAGNVVCGRLWNLNKDVHCIELGSIVDAAVGLLSRSPYRNAGNKIKNILRNI